MKKAIGNCCSLVLLLFTCTVYGQQNVSADLYELKPAEDYSLTPVTVTLDNGVEYSIAVHYWSAGNNNLVFMIHGYADSCVYPKPLQRWFLGNTYDVICMELPGHGLSSGEPGIIGEMEDYAQITESVLRQTDFNAYRHTAFYGHSTGNVGLMEMLLDGDTHPFDVLIMATPLVRTKHWHLSKLGKNIFGWMLPRMQRRDLIDEPEYVSLKEKDPDYLHKVPMDFFRAVIRWNNRLKTDTRQSTEPVHVIFAENDRVINTRFNQQFFEDHFPGASFRIIEGSGHMLHYSPPEARMNFYTHLESILITGKVPVDNPNAYIPQ